MDTLTYTLIIISHPSSIDALCALPPSYPSSHSTILTGSSDGLLRAVQLLPTKLVGVIADHGDFPIERVHVDMAGTGRWVGSAGHEEVLKMTDLKDVFEDEDEDEDEGNAESEKMEDEEEEGISTTDLSGKGTGVGSEAEADVDVPVANDKNSDDDEEEGEEEEAPQEKKRKRQKQAKDELVGRKKKGRNQIDSDPSFFSGL